MRPAACPHRGTPIIDAAACFASYRLPALHAGIERRWAQLDLRAWHEGERTRWDASVAEGGLDVRQEAWMPWRA
jgi:hypothetical protein